MCVGRPTERSGLGGLASLQAGDIDNDNRPLVDGPWTLGGRSLLTPAPR